MTLDELDRIFTAYEMNTRQNELSRNDAEEDDEAEDSRRNIPMKQIKISIQLSFHDII